MEQLGGSDIIGEHIFIYKATSDNYALAFSKKTPSNYFKFALGSFKESSENAISIIEHKEDEKEFHMVQEIPIKFPPTKL